MQILRPTRQHQLFLHHHLSKYGAQSVCMFSVLKAAETHGGSHQKKKRPVFDKYAAAVSSFVESYIEAHQIYPKLSEVVRGTGGSRSTIKRILDELNPDKGALRCKEVCVEGLDDMKVRHTTRPVTECMPSNNNDEFEQFAPEVVSSQVELTDSTDSETDNEQLALEVLSAQVELTDSADSETDNEQLAPEVLSAQVELTDNMDSETDNEQLTEEVLSAQVKVSTDSTDSETDTEGIDILDKNLEKKGHSGLTDPASLTLLDQAMHSSNKADTNQRVAPLMEVLQQKSSGSSRRVHLSASGGIENDISWDKTLLSIMPTSVGGKEDTSGGKDEQPKSFGYPSSSSRKSIDSSQNASGLKYTAKLISSKENSILSTLSAPQLLKALKSDTEVFKNLKKVKMFPRISNINSYAILQFKNNESKEKALKLKIITIVGEQFSLREGSAALLDSINTQPAGVDKASVLQQVMQGLDGSQKKDASSEILHSPTYSCAANKKSDVRMQAQPVSHASFSQIITIHDCPNDVLSQSIQSFFSVFGNVRASSGPATPSKRTIFVEFKNGSDKEKALKVQQFTVDGYSFLIRTDAPCDAVVVRLKCVQSEINHKAVVNACKKYGSVENVFLRRCNAMDVHFRAEERKRIDMLLNSLHTDEYLERKFKLSLLCDGYIKADDFLECHTERVEKLAVLFKELATHLSGMLGSKFGSLNQLAADIERTSATSKVV